MTRQVPSPPRPAREEIEAARRWFADSRVLVGEAASERAITTLAESGELERFDQLDLPGPLPAFLAGDACTV